MLRSKSDLTLDIGVEGQGGIQNLDTIGKKIDWAVQRQENLNARLREQNKILAQMKHEYATLPMSGNLLGMSKEDVNQQRLSLKNAIYAQQQTITNIKDELSSVQMYGKQAQFIQSTFGDAYAKTLGERRKQLQAQTKFENQYYEAERARIHSVAEERVRQAQTNAQKYIQERQREWDKTGKLQAQASAEDLKRNQANEKMLNQAHAMNEKYDSQLRGMAKSVEKFKMIFGRVVDALISFVAINWTYQIFVGFFSSLIKSNQMLEVLSARMKQLSRDSKEIEDTWQYIAQFTITTPFKIQEVVEATVTLKAFGLDVQKNLKYVGDWAAGVGKDLNDVAQAYAKILSYSPRTALLLSTRGFNIQALRLYTSEFGSRAEALRHMIDDSFGGSAQRIASTFEGILSNLNDIWVFASQRLGKDLFKDLKGDLEIIYRVLNNLSKSDALETMGKLLTFFTKSAVMFAFGTAIAFVATQLAKLTTWLQAGSALAMTFKSWFARGSFILFGVSAVADRVKQIDITKQQIEVEKTLSGVLTDTERLSAQREYVEILKKRRDLYSGFRLSIGEGAGIDFGGGMYRLLNSQVNLEQSVTEQLEIQKNSREIILMKTMAQVDAMRDLEASQIIQENGLKEFNNLLAANFKARANAIQFNSLVYDEKGLRLFGKQTEQDRMRKAGFEAMSIYLEGLSGGIKRSDAINRIKEMLTEWSLKTEIPGIKEFTIALQEYLEALKQIGDLKKDKSTKIAKIYSPIEVDWNSYKNALEDYQKSVEQFNIEQMKYRYSISGQEQTGMIAEKAILEQRRLDILNRINVLENQSKMSYVAGTKDEQKVKEILDDIVQAKHNGLDIDRQIFEINKYIYSISDEWADVFAKKLSTIKLSQAKINQDFLETIYQGTQELAKSGFDELIWGTRSKDLTSQIDDLRFQLIQVQQEKAGIKLVEDQEISVLARINDLERQRAQIVLQFLDDFARKIIEFGENKLVEYLWGVALSPSTPALSKPMNTGAGGDYGGGMGGNIIIHGDIYGYEDFSNKVNKAVKYKMSNKI